MKNAIFIPVRGGSKRIPNKNIKILNDKPLLWYSLDAASQTNNDIYVATDSDKIIKCVKDYNLKYNKSILTYKRNPNNCTDSASTESAIAEFVNLYPEYKNIFLIQATSPMIQKEDIDNIIEKLKIYDSALSVCEDKSFRWNEDAKSIDYDIYNRPRSQEFERYRETGAIYGFTREGFIKHNNRLFGNIGMYIMPELRSFEIDTNEDWELIEKIIK